jgi:hypothetical protein
MKMGTIVSLWRYDVALRRSRKSLRLRRIIRKQSPHDLRVALDGQQQRTGWCVGRAAALLPIAQRRDGQMEGFGKFPPASSRGAVAAPSRATPGAY